MMEHSAQQVQDTYRINQIQMASKEQLLIITYDIGIKACVAAERALGVNDVEQINSNLQKAQAVIRELMLTLNMEQGGEVAIALMKLYDYMYHQLVDANVRKASEPVSMVRQMMEELKSTWVEAINKLKAESKEKQPAVAARPAGGTNFAY
jgi:flagellar protein FliS